MKNIRIAPRFINNNKAAKKYGAFSLIFRRKAFAIPLVLLMSVVLMIFATMLLNTNTQSKKQKNSTVMATKGYFMAQGAIQHFKLKYRLLPSIMFNAGLMYLGFSPFYAPSGINYDQMDNINDCGKRYPQCLARFAEDISTYGTQTVANAPALIDTTLAGIDNTEINQKGGMNTLPLTKGGFNLQDSAANEDFTEWGYRIVKISNGSIKKGVENGRRYSEQSVTIEVEGQAKANVGGQESQYTKSIVTETLLVRKWSD